MGDIKNQTQASCSQSKSIPQDQMPKLFFIFFVPKYNLFKLRFLPICQDLLFYKVKMILDGWSRIVAKLLSWTSNKTIHVCLAEENALSIRGIP